MFKLIIFTILPLIQQISGQNCDPSIQHVEHTVLTTNGKFGCHNIQAGNSCPQALTAPPISCETNNKEKVGNKLIFNRYCNELATGNEWVKFMTQNKWTCGKLEDAKKI